MTDTNSDAVLSERAHVIAVVGPTGVGKSRLAEALALALGGEVVSADSMQIYRGMDIGTAKPEIGPGSPSYHLLDVAEPGSAFSAALYQRLAREAIDGIAARRRTPIVCGGTGLYVRAALDDMRFPTGDQSSAARGDIEALAAEVGPQASARSVAGNRSRAARR